MTSKSLGMLVALSLLSSAIAPAIAFNVAPQTSGTVAVSRFGSDAIAKTATDPKTGYPVVEGERWDKSSTWFKPVLVQDGSGSYLAVLDKQKQGAVRLPQLGLIRTIGMFSNWSRDGIRLYGNTQTQVCFWALCGTNYPRVEVEAIEVKVDDQVFAPQREGDKFLVDADLAQALQSATPGKVLVRMHLKPGVSSTQALSDETIKALPTIYQQASAPTGIVPVPVGGAELGSGSGSARIVAVAPFPEPPKNASSQDAIRDSNTGLPLVNGATWRTRQNIPWSRMALVRDEFDGEYQAVFARDGAFASSWSRNFVDVVVSKRFLTVQSIQSVPALQITAGRQSITLSGEHNRFPIDDRAARFLFNAGNNPSAKPIVSYLVSKNGKATYSIDSTTTKLWATLYR
jgi:hypothetical protein